ncbi:MAG: sensor histidine kinase [Eubacterium sp.]|nr:sensor histidine kinase [Eubacterium sp.]
MDKSEWNRQIRRSYLHDRYKVIVSYLLMAAIFFGIAALYGYGQILRNMFYAVELAIFFGILIMLADYRSYRAKCRALFLAMQQEGERTCDLPETRSLPEMLYRQLLMESEQERRKILTMYDAKQKDMADYYTMWTHQIKTPIAALRLLLQNREGTEEGQAETDSMREAEELFKIEQYAQMALYFARLDSPSSDFVFRECDVRDVVKQAVRKYSVLFLRSGLNFCMEEFTLKAVTDEKWLCFVVEQVFSNALKYTQQGGIMIYGSDAEGNSRQGEVSYLTIGDTGISIMESDLPRIFERGFTGYNGRVDEKSTGLGLYLCDRIMRRMAHTIKVSSKPGAGTKVVMGFVQGE